MDDDVSHEEEVLLAVALGSPRQATDRRMLPDRRSGVERRKTRQHVSHERRCVGERRKVIRRKLDREEGATLLQKARTHLTRPFRQSSEEKDPADGLR
jgi:hypothetical protein